MKKYRAVWKIEPEFELEEGEDLEEAIQTRMMDLTMNPYDFIEFIEFEED